MNKITLLALIIPTIVGALAFFPVNNDKEAFHTEVELTYFKSRNLALSDIKSPEGLLLLPIDSSVLFPTGKVCGGCHGRDPNNHALVSTSGVDVNIYDDWRSTMMANSAKDPFWRAKVSHEILVNPTHSLELQDKCTSCHAPAGHYQAKLHNHQQFYTLADVVADTLGLDGVNCQMCHAQAPEKIGNLFSGELNFDTTKIRVAYGPYEMAFVPPMQQFIGITPKFGEHIQDAGVCAGCHTLITKTVDFNGDFTGNTFVEQATYHEWLNSRYDEDHDNITCQGCHIPSLEDEIIIAANYQFLTPKYPFGLHEMAGANVPMLELLRDNRQQLGINALPEHFDSTIAATVRMLQQKTLDLTVTPGVVHGDSLHFEVQLINKAGHKFPSGYPARRAWIELEVKNQSGQTIFHSGRMNADRTLADEDANFEPHYNTINNQAQVQIYELVPGDVNGVFTSVLERGDTGLKDNRLVPQGFYRSDAAYDTTRIIGGALQDPDFNHDIAGTEGSGSDIVHYVLPTQGYTGTLTVTARVWYQSLPPKWLMPMFAYSSPEIDAFKAMFESAENAPVLIAQQVLADLSVSPVASHETAKQTGIRVFPTLCMDGKVQVVSTVLPVQRVEILDAAGNTLKIIESATSITLPSAAGVYYLNIILTNRRHVVQKIVRF